MCVCCYSVKIWRVQVPNSMGLIKHPFNWTPCSRLKLDFVVQSLSRVWLSVGLMDRNTPGFPVLHCLLEFVQIHVLWVVDAIQPSHSLLSPSPPALSFSQRQGLFRCAGSSHQMGKILELQHPSSEFTVLPENIQCWFPLGLTGLISLQSKGLSREDF